MSPNIAKWSIVFLPHSGEKIAHFVNLISGLDLLFDLVERPIFRAAVCVSYPEL